MADDSKQLRCDVNVADEAKQRRLERHPEFGHAGAVLAGARPAWDVKNQWLAIGVCVACSVVGPKWLLLRGQRCRLYKCVWVWRSNQARFLPTLPLAQLCNVMCRRCERVYTLGFWLEVVVTVWLKEPGAPGRRHPCHARSVRTGTMKGYAHPKP